MHALAREPQSRHTSLRSRSSSRDFVRVIASALLALSVLALSPYAHAQKEEPKPPGTEGDDTEAPPRPRTRPDGAPIPVYSSDPNAPANKKFDPLDWRNALGVYGRYLFVTELMMKPYVDASTSLSSFSLGLQYTRRYTHFDVVTSLDFSWLTLNDGNWLSSDRPDLDTHFVQFDKLSFLSADVAIIGHHAFNNWLEIRGGVGLGLGVVFGNVYTTNDSTMCTKANASDVKACYPISPVYGPIMLNQPDTNANLKKTEQSDATDTAQFPHRTRASIPPVMAVVDIMLGLNFRLHKHVSAQVELGFRDAMFAGAGVHYHF